MKTWVKRAGARFFADPRAARPHDDEGIELVETGPWWQCQVVFRHYRETSRATRKASFRIAENWSGSASQRAGPRSGLSARSHFSWDEAPHNLIRDRDRIYGTIATRQLRAMGIRDKPTAPGSLWQNGVAERLTESIRRERLHHIIVLGETHLICAES